MPAQSQATPKTNLDIDRGAHTIRLTRVFDAPRAEIFQAWTRPEHVRCWWGAAAAGGPLAACEIDLRPGGAFRFVSKGHPDMPFTGTYREIAPPDRLVFEAIGSHRRGILEGCWGRVYPSRFSSPARVRGRTRPQRGSRQRM